ncbi:GspH/FimT family protein [Desulfurobacterium atlanticum]|uniref:Type II secretion system protein H n=1 Tax=Desulfurobacterium atlanticum TaxID=240169 RepID=A0A238XL04_9BACT|nr:GspH/FimT family protein [Desulfurobacterium atlanticum]SNR59362.1 type II secretion system protein H [Desulfurobacterium atlanticum]
MKKLNAFTLTELIIVIAIVGIIAAIAVPKIGRWINSTKVRQVAEQLTADLQFAQGLAMEKGSSKVKIYSDRYEIYAPETATTPIKSITIDDTNISLLSNFTNNEIKFRRNKLPITGGTIVISGYGVTYNIVINNIGGRIQLKRL